MDEYIPFPIFHNPSPQLYNSIVHCLLCEIVASKIIILMTLDNQRNLHQKAVQLAGCDSR